MKMPSVMRGSSRFARVPQAKIPRSQFNLSHGHKTSFDIGYLVPVFHSEVLPGDTFNVKMSAFARLSTPVKPLMDNLYMDSHFFFVPYRLIWPNFVKFMGEQEDPGDSISYTVPQKNVAGGGWDAGQLQDYFGLPTDVASTTTSWTVSALPFRAYHMIWNHWFRDQNLQDTVSHEGVSGTSWNPGDGPDGNSATGGDNLLRRGKRHDYFTSCLPWAQKGDASSVALEGDGSKIELEGRTSGTEGEMRIDSSAGTGTEPLFAYSGSGAWSNSETLEWKDPALALDINDLREAIQIQKLLERDARSGTRYPEKIMAHFGVEDPQMAVLQRPEYLGGGSAPININPIVQQSATESGTYKAANTEQGNLTATGTMVASGHGFTKSFTEHGIVIGLVSVRCDLNYQEGVERFWSRSTMYDFYFPAFAHLGEQAVLNKELVMEDATSDDEAFGYQERWSEYKYKKSYITGEFRSNHAQTLEVWHLAEDFAGSCPNLDASFIVVNPDIDRCLASTTNHHFLFDSYFRVIAARPMPMYSIPGNMDRF